MVLKAQSFRFNHIDLKTTIIDTFITSQVNEYDSMEEAYSKTKIDFSMFYKACNRLKSI